MANLLRLAAAVAADEQIVRHHYAKRNKYLFTSAQQRHCIQALTVLCFVQQQRHLTI